MYAHPHPGIPSGIIERTDRETLRQDALRITRMIHRCDDAAKHLKLARTVVDGIGADGEVAADLADAINAIDDALTAVKVARTALDESISPAMEDAL